MRRFAEAYRALAFGRSAADCRRAARFHSNAFWGWLVIAVLVWAAFGFKWALLPLGLAMVSFYQNRSATMMAEFIEGRRGDPGSG